MSPDQSMIPDRAAGGTTASPSDLEAQYLAALRDRPGEPAPHNALGELRWHQQRWAEAAALFRRAVALSPNTGTFHANLGRLMLDRRRPDDALPHLNEALKLDPTLIGAHDARATALCLLNRYPESLADYRAIYRLEPSNNSARYLEALALLALGDFRDGWRKHESRWYAALGADNRITAPEPHWLGEDDIAGRTILLHAEQGHGDTCQFVRYVPKVIALGARVLLLVQPPLKPLFADIPGIAGVFALGEPLPPFELQCSLMSLPRAFQTEVDTIPSDVPYIEASAERIARWAERLGDPGERRRIAIAWSGTDTVWNRPIPLTALALLLHRDDCDFHIVQTDFLLADRAAMADLPMLIDHSAELRDFADTAGLLSVMDQVVSVDTVLAHLAGGMGLPTWTMLPFGCDYRWMTHGDTSPRYPTMRLFGQPALHDWDSVVASVNRALDGTRT